MSSDGELGCLDKPQFDTLIKAQLLQQQVSPSSIPQDRIIDIRFAAEYKLCDSQASRNIPINQFRDQLATLDPQQSYGIVPANDCRSDLAAYLMKQAGFTT